MGGANIGGLDEGKRERDETENVSRKRESKRYSKRRARFEEGVEGPPHPSSLILILILIPIHHLHLSHIASIPITL